MCTLLIILGISTIINATLFNYKYLHHGLGLLLIILTEVSGNALLIVHLNLNHITYLLSIARALVRVFVCSGPCISLFVCI